MFLYSLESKFHDLFKTHLTFIFKSLLRDPGSFKVKKQIFEWTPSSAHIMAPKTLRSIFYQMEHIWWAPIGLRNSSRLQLGSQLSPTLYHSFIVYLYLVSNAISFLIDFNRYIWSLASLCVDFADPPPLRPPPGLLRFAVHILGAGCQTLRRKSQLTTNFESP